MESECVGPVDSRARYPLSLAATSLLAALGFAREATLNGLQIDHATGKVILDESIGKFARPDTAENKGNMCSSPLDAFFYSGLSAVIYP